MIFKKQVCISKKTSEATITSKPDETGESRVQLLNAQVLNI